MKKRKFITKKDGTRIVEPDDSLMEKIGKHTDLNTVINDDVIAKANKFIEDDKGSYASKTLNDVKKLETLFAEFSILLDKDSDNLRIISKIVLSIKSNSAIYGYDLASIVARSLYNFLAETDFTEKKDFTFVNVHMTALYVIFSQDIKENGGDIGQEIITELKKLNS